MGRFVGKLPAEESAIKGEGKGPEGRGETWHDLCGQAAAVHRVYPGRRKFLNSTHNPQNRVGTTTCTYPHCTYPHPGSL
jgi:hypothetical protein